MSMLSLVVMYLVMYADDTQMIMVSLIVLINFFSLIPLPISTNSDNQLAFVYMLMLSALPFCHQC